MPTTKTPSLSAKPLDGPADRRAIWWVALGLAAATGIVYANSLSVPFIFDDLPAIVHNPSIRHLWRVNTVLSPPLDAAGAVGRPLVNLSFAINYALGELNPTGYHLLNIAFHIATGLLLFAVVQRTLLQPWFNERYTKNALGLAASIALLWVTHPLQTESVTFVTQRNEIFVGLFYLLTLYCFIRSTNSPFPIRWQAGSIVSCFLGMASKEVMVSAPLIVLLYERTFLVKSFADAWRRHRGMYIGLASTWCLLAFLVIGNAERAGTVGFGLGVSSWHYLLTQCGVIVHYVRLAVWPHPLVLDYGTDISTQLSAVLPQAILLTALVVFVAVRIHRKCAWGFVGAWFFFILAPSSSVIPLTTQTMAEHRMYLPLISMVIVAVFGINRLAGRWTTVICVFLTPALAVATWYRNRDYGSTESIWRDTVSKQPRNPRAHLNLGSAMKESGRVSDAIVHYEAAVRLKPDYAEAHFNLGTTLLLAERIPEGLAQLTEALVLSPSYEDARLNLALALARAGRPTEALSHFELLLPLRPLDAGLRYNLGNTLLVLNRPAEAVRSYEAAVQIEPTYANAHYNLGNALLALDRIPEAERHFMEAVKLQPAFSDAHLLLGTLWAGSGRHAEAIARFENVVRLNPSDHEAFFLLGRSLETIGRPRDAEAAYERSLRLDPSFEPARQAIVSLRRSRR